jgi:hypothetical protein
MKKKMLIIALPLLMLAAGLTYAFTGSQASDIDNCPLKGTADCPLIKDCPKKGTPDCPYAQSTANTDAEASSCAQAGDDVPECCRKK